MFLSSRLLVAIRKNGQLGQVAIEYTLLLIVILTMITALVGRVKEFMLDGAENCTATSTSIACKYENLFSTLKQNGYRYFSIKR
jgi:hypothetical protein